jgi:ABC-type nitrate/sulfonate/bicarbonate transport system substrate-binding protein
MALSGNSRVIATAYSAAFVCLQVWYLGIIVSLFFRGSGQETWWAGPVVSCFLVLQLLRMYYYLHQLEERIAVSGASSFLEILPDRARRRERALRTILAVLLVAFAKVGPAAVSSPVFGVPSLLLGCFALLMLWDWQVWSNLRDAFKNPDCSILVSQACRFFYAPADIPAWEPYWKTARCWERVLGFLAAASAFLFFFTAHALALTAFIGLAILFLFVATIGTMREDPTRSIPEFFRELLDTLLNPVVALIGGETMSKGRRKNPRLWIALVGLLALGAVAFGCPRSETERASGTEPRAATTVRVVTSKNLWCALTLVADEERLFLKEGLDVDLQYQAAGRLNMDALLGESADIANVVETNVAYQALAGTSNLAVHSVIVSAYDFVLLTAEASGIGNVGDLVGKRIAYAQATGAESFLFWFLEAKDIPVGSVVLVPLQPAGLVDAFVNGAADAVVAWEPFASTIRSRPIRLGWTFEAAAGDFAGLMLVASRKEWASQNADVLEAYERAMRRAAEVVRSNPERAQEIVARQTGLPLATVQAIWHRFLYAYRLVDSSDVAFVNSVASRIRTNVPEFRERRARSVESYVLDR